MHCCGQWHSLTLDALAHHNQRHNNPIKRVKIRLFNGDFVGWYSLGEKPETVLTFPGEFTVGEILHDEYEKWVRKAKEGDIRDNILTRTLPGGETIDFVQINDIKALILDNHCVAGLEQKIGTLDQTEITGLITEAETTLEQVTADGNLMDLNDIQPISVGTGVFSDWVSSEGIRRLDVASSPSSLASNDWFPDESMASDDCLSDMSMESHATNP